MRAVPICMRRSILKMQWPCQHAVNWTVFMPSKAREHKRLGSLAKGWEVSKRARALRRVDRRHAAVCDKAPGQPPLRPEAIVNLLAITFWATFVLWPLATWVLEYS